MRNLLGAVLLFWTLFPLFSLAASHPVDPFKEIEIVDPLVMRDSRAAPGGPWHFGTLIRKLLPSQATDEEVSQFVIQWLHEYDTVTSFNGFNVRPRLGVRTRVICPWLNASTGKNDCTGTLDLKKAPFRLLAIVNRFDLRHSPTSQNGKLQFVFGVLSKPTTNPLSPSVFVTSFSVLMSYELVGGGCLASRHWARRWHRIGKYACDSSAGCTDYLEALQEITDAVTDLRGNACPIPACSHVPTQARLEVHSNDLAIGSPWQLRRFILQGGCGKIRQLKLAGMSRTPDTSLNNSTKLIDWVSKNEVAVRSGNYFLPKEFIGASADETVGGFSKWRLNGVSEETRFAFAKNTCNGCHSDEFPNIFSTGFFHLSTFGEGKKKLSSFVLNEEIPRRKKFLEEWLRRETCEDTHENP